MQLVSKVSPKTILLCGTILLPGLLALKMFDGVESLVAPVSVLLQRGDLVVLMVTAYSLAFVLRAFGWKWILHAPVAADRLFQIQMVGLLLNHLFPFKTGEAAKVYLLTESGHGVGQATTSVLVSRWVDLLALGCVFLLFGFFSMHRLVFETRPVIVCLVLLMALGFLFRFLAKPVLPEFVRKVVGEKIATFLCSLQKSVGRVRRLDVFRAFATAVPSWVLESVVLWCIVLAADLPLSFMACIMVTSFTILAQMFGLTPGGLGTYEASMVLALKVLGVHLETGLSLALLSHGFKFLYAYLFGAVSLATLQSGSACSKGAGVLQTFRQWHQGSVAEFTHCEATRS